MKLLSWLLFVYGTNYCSFLPSLYTELKKIKPNVETVYGSLHLMAIFMNFITADFLNLNFAFMVNGKVFLNLSKVIIRNVKSSY